MTKQTEVPQSYLTFKLGDEIFATNVNKVLEILEIPRITKVPHAPDFMRGVINLRGNVMPVINTRLKFGLPEVEDTVTSCIVVVDIEMDGQNVTLGTVVDSVQEVIEISGQDIQPAPSIGSKYRSEFINGMVKIDEQFIMVLNLDRVFSTDEALLIQNAVADNDAVDVE